MTCRREEILARLLEILESVEGIKEVARNVDEFPDIARPMAILLDGDEEAVPELARPWIKGRAVTIVDMTPLILVMMGGPPDTIGPDVNELMARVVTAVMSDNELSQIVTTNGGVYYTATDYRLSHDMAIDCDLQMRFRIRYPLLPTHP